MDNLTIDKLILIDDTGMPVAPTIRQLMDIDVKQLYTRDKTKDKSKYIQECIVIYYLGDPKSPAKQAGLSDAEALKMAIEQAGLRKDYLPDSLVLRLIKKYYKQNITEAGMTVEVLLQGMHNVSLAVKTLQRLLNEKLNSQLTVDEASNIITILDKLNTKAGEIPGLVKKLDEAKQNLMYEAETQLSRGGAQVLSSMDADEYD